MNKPTEQQQEIMRDRDARIGLPNENNTEAVNAPPRPVLQQPGPISPSAIELLTPKQRIQSERERTVQATFYNSVQEWVMENCEDGTGYANGRRVRGYFCEL